MLLRSISKTVRITSFGRCLFAIGMAGGLVACSTPPIVDAPGTVVIELDGEKVWIAKMPGKDAWAATRYRVGPLLSPNPALETQFLSRAIEKVTKCAVAHANYDPGLLNLYVVVRC